MTDNSSEQPRCRILMAAKKLFHRKGFHATSINDVAEEAGVLKGHLSYYFPSKSSLLVSTTSVIENELHNQLASWGSTPGNYQNAIKQVLQTYEASADELATWGCIIGTLNNELARTEGALQVEPRHLLEIIHNWFREQFAREFPQASADKLSEQLLCMLQGMTFMANAYREPALVGRQLADIRQWLGTLSTRQVNPAALNP